MIKVICDKCDKEIIENETVWNLEGIANYGSCLDGYGKVKLQFCDNCLSKFMDRKEKGLLEAAK